MLKLIIHIGEKVNKRAKELRIGPTELAKTINTSKQNIYSIFKRESIDTALLQKLSKALNYDFFVFFINKNLPPNTKINTKSYPLLEDMPEYNILKTQLLDLKEKYRLLKKINSLLEERNTNASITDFN